MWQVISFEEITQGDGVPLHRPAVCSVHGGGAGGGDSSGAGQLMRYFCNTCQQPICNECLMHEHQQPGHQYEKIGGDVERREVRAAKKTPAKTPSQLDDLCGGLTHCSC